MTSVRFLQIHTLHSYTAALLNRDDSGLSKRLPYGGVLRTRISSQCLKRHWRKPDGNSKVDLEPHAISKVEGFVDSFRSRELVTKMVFAPLRLKFPEKAEALKVLETEFQKAVYGEDKGAEKKTRQTLLFGAPELAWLAAEAEKLATSVSDAKAAKKAAEDWSGGGKEKKEFKKNIEVLRENTALPGGLIAALFGRMVTSDTAANIEAPVHVAHSFTVHAAENESDYFTAVDDLKEEDDDSGADTIQETELTSGLYYGYVVIDLPGLIKNCGGDADKASATALAANIVHNLLYLIAEVSPGAKLGSTAPYDRASFLLVEAGDRQPRSLAGAFRKAVEPDLDQAVHALARHLKQLDEVYATDEARQYLSLSDIALDGAERGSLAKLAAWARDRAGETQ
jgi:CRISPR system Cascade subunit CasC